MLPSGSATGSVTIHAAPGGPLAGAATGTVTCLFGDPADNGAATGTVTIDASSSFGLRTGVGPAAYAAHHRRNAALVSVGGANVSRFLVDRTLIEEDDTAPVRHASFSVKHPAVAYLHPSSISNGEKATSVQLVSGPLGREATVSLFSGTTLAGPNDGAWATLAAFSAQSRTAAYLDVKLCYEDAALSGKTRGDRLVEIAALYGIPLTGDLSGSPVKKQLVLNGTTFGAYLAIHCLIEGKGSRVADDGVSIELYDEDAAPVSSFGFRVGDGATYPGIREIPPVHPVTRYVVTGTEIVPSALSGTYSTFGPITVASGTREDGTTYRTDLTITSYGGAPVREVLEEYDTFQIGGVVLGPLGFRLKKRTTTLSTWATASTPYGVLPSTRLDRRVTTVEEYRGTECQTVHDVGFEPQLWTDTKYYTQPAAVFGVSQETVEENVYDVPSCSLAAAVKTTSSYYSPLGDGHVYGDGASRVDAVFQWRVTGVERVSWATYLSRTSVTTELDAWKVTTTSLPLGAGGPVETFGPSKTLFEFWLTVPNGQVLHSTTEATVGTAGSTSTKAEIIAGPLPTPPKGSLTVVAYQQRFFSADVSVDDGRYAANEVIDNSLEAYLENVEEAVRVIYRRLRKQWGATYSVPGRILPFRIGSGAAITDAKHYLGGAVGWMRNIQRGIGHPNGENEASYDVYVPPEIEIPS